MLNLEVKPDPANDVWYPVVADTDYDPFLCRLLVYQDTGGRYGVVTIHKDEAVDRVRKTSTVKLASGESVSIGEFVVNRVTGCVHVVTGLNPFTTYYVGDSPDYAQRSEITEFSRLAQADKFVDKIPEAFVHLPFPPRLRSEMSRALKAKLEAMDSSVEVKFEYCVAVSSFLSEDTLRTQMTAAVAELTSLCRLMSIDLPGSQHGYQWVDTQTFLKGQGDTLLAALTGVILRRRNLIKRHEDLALKSLPLSKDKIPLYPSLTVYWREGIAVRQGVVKTVGPTIRVLDAINAEFVFEPENLSVNLELA